MEHSGLEDRSQALECLRAVFQYVRHHRVYASLLVDPHSLACRDGYMGVGCTVLHNMCRVGALGQVRKARANKGLAFICLERLRHMPLWTDQSGYMPVSI